MPWRSTRVHAWKFCTRGTGTEANLARTVLLGKTGQQDIARHPMSGDIGKKKTSEIYILIILLSRHFDLNGIFSGFE